MPLAFRLLRIPFSVFLMPMYWFALSATGAVPVGRAVAVFGVLHLLAYPASNGYNSYFDRDEGAIGGLEFPPAVTGATRTALWRLVVLFDVLAIGGGLLVNVPFGLGVAVYLLISKAYSWDRTRWKKYPIWSTVVVTVFQGAYTFLLVQVGIGLPSGALLTLPNLLLALVSTVFLAGSYPLTQVYQHQEDARRGDLTLSRLLGIRGTFRWAGALMLTGTALLGVVYVLLLGQPLRLGIFLLATGPVVLTFGRWAWAAWQQGETAADWQATMRLNRVSSLSLSAAFGAMLWLGH